MEANTLNLPVLALRGLTVFPHTNLTFDVERRISIKTLEVAMESNEEALASDQRLNALYRLPDVNEYMLGHLFYFLMLSIAYEGELANVDAYDQPGVEIYKRLMGEKLKKR